MTSPRSGYSDDPQGSCATCGGDGKLTNAWGQVAKCPSCGGSGRKREEQGFRDVTKTKESHHRPTNRAGAPAEKQTWPTSAEGMTLATEIRDSSLSDDVKAKLTRGIIEHETSHGHCTQTFLKKLRKQVRPAVPPR